MLERRGQESHDFDDPRHESPAAPPATARLLELQRSAGNQAVARAVASASLLQRFAAPVATRPEVRISESGTIVITGKKELYATQDRIDEANTALAEVAGGKGAFLRLKGSGGGPPSLEGMPELQGLLRVEPVWTSREMAVNQPEMQELDKINKVKDAPYMSHADCHMTAQTIMGSTENLSNIAGGEKAIVEGFAENAETAVEPIEKKVADQKGWASHGANRVLDAFIIEAVPKFAARLKAQVDDPDNQGAAGGKMFALYKEVIAYVGGAAAGTEGLPRLRLGYRKIVENKVLKHAFGQMFGVNQYAEPEIGDALVQFNDEAEKKSEEIKTAKREDEVVRREEAGEQPSPATLPPEGRDIWNFHWAGVIMKDGLDYVTLENLSVEFTSVKNDLWYFAMYGPLEQSFHSEAARDTHVGNWPTTVKFRFQG